MSVASLLTSYIEPRFSVDQQGRHSCFMTKECRDILSLQCAMVRSTYTLDIRVLPLSIANLKGTLYRARPSLNASAAP